MVQVPNEGAKKRGRRPKSWLLHEDETAVPVAARWQLCCPAEALGSGLGQSWAGGRKSTGQAKQESRAKSPTTAWEDVRKAPFFGSWGPGGEWPLTFKPSTPWICKSQAWGLLLSIILGNIIKLTVITTPIYWASTPKSGSLHKLFIGVLSKIDPLSIIFFHLSSFSIYWNSHNCMV